MSTPYSIGIGKTGTCKGKIWEVRMNYVEGEGGYDACKRSITSRRKVEQQ
jgi:hypothetical protein